MAVGLYNLYQIFARRIFGALADYFPFFDWVNRLLVWDMPRILGTVLIVALGLWFIRGPKAPAADGPAYTPPESPPEPMKETPWTQAEARFHEEPEPQAPEVPEEPVPVTLEWKSEFNVEKYEKEQKKEADHA